MVSRCASLVDRMACKSGRIDLTARAAFLNAFKYDCSLVHDTDVISYNCSEPPKPPEMLPVEPDCHWLEDITFACCVIQAIKALWLLPPGPPPPEPFSKK